MGNPGDSWRTTYFGDLGIGTLAPTSRQLQPPALQDGAVVLQSALVLAFTPATPVVWIRFQAQAAAIAHSTAFVQVDCGEKRQEKL